MNKTKIERMFHFKKNHVILAIAMYVRIFIKNRGENDGKVI